MRNAECGIERAGSITSNYLSSRKSLDPFRIPHSALRIRMTLGLLIFAATYLLIAIQRLPFVHLNRPAASLLGAVAMVVLGVLPLRDAYAAIDFDVLVFLLGLMLIVGSVVSVTGNPQNMLVGIWSGASFGGFLAHMLPVGGGSLAITYGCLRWAYRAELREPFRGRLETVPVALDRPLVLKALVLFGVAVIAWLGGGSLPLVAITAGAVMVAVAQRDPAYAIDRVEWSLLLFFASLFVVMRGFEQTGAVAWIDDHALRLVQGGSHWGAAVAVSGVMTTLSNLISNVPAVILWRNTVPTIPNPDLMWRVVVVGVTFAGHPLLIGSIGNLIVAERPRTPGVRTGCREDARIGAPGTLPTLARGIVVR